MSLEELKATIHQMLEPKRKVGITIVVDLSSAEDYDSYIVVWLAALKRWCAEHAIGLRLTGMSTRLENFIGLLEKPLLTQRTGVPIESSLHSYVAAIGATTLRNIADARFFVEFIGELVMSLVELAARPMHTLRSRRSEPHALPMMTMRWEDLPIQLTRAGVGAVSIVALIGFLMGLIIGYQGAVQLSQFGADIYLADMVAIALTRELAPLMTAIIVAGRSGAAFAAEIGTMQVSEEIDALRAMGFNIMRFLVLPRVLAVMIAMPFLVLFSDIAGIIGGLLIGVSVLDISLMGYLHETQTALTYWHIGTGLIKSVALGCIVAVIGCMRGLQVRGGAESVGTFTTAAVVTGIFLIIVADALFTLLFQALGI